MVERRLVGPYGQRPTLTDGASPSKSVASSHESRAGSARDRTGRRERKGERGARDNGEKRKQYTTRCLPLPKRKHNTRNNSNQHSNRSNPYSRSGSSSSAFAVTDTDTTVMVDNVTVYDTYHRNVDVYDLETKSRFDNVYSCRHFLNDCIMRVSDASTSCRRRSMR